MATNCPICEQAMEPGAAVCGTCGYPAALALDALKALAEPTSAPIGDSPTAPGGTIESAPMPAVDPQEAVCNRIALQIDAELNVLVDLGGDPLAIASELRQAALSQADRRVVEALGLLRQAHARLATQTDELFEARVRDVEERALRLRGAGVAVSIDDDLARLRAEMDDAERAPALRRLHELDDRLARLEGDWNGLRSLLRQIEGLREAIKSYRAPIPEVEEDVTRVRALLARPGVTPSILDEASQIASRGLMLLHEELPPHFEAELTRHAASLEKYPEDHPKAQAARSAHAEAVRHLRRGRLSDANERLIELRKTLEGMTAERPATPRPAPATVAPVAPAPLPAGPATALPTTEEDDAALQRLLEKARGLAQRVRSLPAESEVAFEAAGEIRRATEFLRARRLGDADLTLSRLMQTLSVEPAPEAG